MLRSRGAAAPLRIMMSSALNPNPTSLLFLINNKPASSKSSFSTNNNNNSKTSNFQIPINPNFIIIPQKLTSSKDFCSDSPVTNTSSILMAKKGGGDVEEPTLVVVSFYKFADFPDHADLRAPLKRLCEQLRVSGGIILAPEGINGSICGARESVDKVIGYIESDERLKGLRQVESPVSAEEEAIHHGQTSSSPLSAGEDAPFRWDHVRVKLKKEIVSLGMPSVSPIERVGTYISPKDWNTLISDPETVVIDVRNDYETRIGKFKGAVDPNTSAFREFPSWVDDHYQADQSEDGKLSNGSSGSINPIEERGPKSPPRVAMYCTGGIRCEKATSLLLSKGFKEIFHLEGGILKYLEEIPKTESLWEGECFVFDKRVSVDHGLEPGTFKLCYGCKQPVSDADMETPEWEYGVSCPYCYSSKSEEEKDRARARQRQFEECGVIGGPDKGRRPTKTVSGNDKRDNQMSKSV